MPRTLRLALLLLLLACGIEAQGTKLQDVPVRCPVCRTNFIAYAVVDTGLDGGMDADFFWRSRGEAAENYGVWMCPQCYFTAAPGDFERELPEDKRKLLQDRLPEIVKPRPGEMPEHPESQRKIPAWYKWKVALACYELRKDTLPNPEAYLGDVCLRGSWVTRVTSTLPKAAQSLGERYKDVTRDFAARHKQVLDLLDHSSLHIWFHTRGELMAKDLVRDQEQKDPEKRSFMPDERAVALYLAGAYYREGGDLVQARPYIDQFLQGAKPEQSGPHELAETELALLNTERDFQIAGIAHFQKVIESGSVKGTEREAPCVYLIGELYRRLGNSKEAAIWFDKVEAIPGVPKDLLDIVQRQRKLLLN